MRTRSTSLVVYLVCCALAHGAEDASPGATGAAMSAAAERFLDSLSSEQRSRAVMGFDDPARLDWHNIPKPQRKGLQFRNLDAAQHALCLELMQSGLSPTGYDKALKIMALENNLHEGEKRVTGGHLRDPLRYFVTIFGEPGTAGEWGWSFEGHHFSLNFVIRDGRVVSDTPSFWGANPATVHTFVLGGPEVGTRTLADEEQLAFDLLAALDDAQRRRAVVSDRAPREYRGAGESQPPAAPPEGLPAAEMTAAQQQTLRSLLEAYSGNLAAELADARLAAIDERGFEKVHFAWYGSERPGAPHAYRIQGPTFLLELVNVQSDPAGNPANHIHSVWRSMEGDFGVSAGR